MRRIACIVVTAGVSIGAARADHVLLTDELRFVHGRLVSIGPEALVYRDSTDELHTLAAASCLGVFDPDVPAGENFQRNLMRVEKLLQLKRASANLIAVVVSKVAELMGSRDDRVNSIVDGHPCHGERSLEIGRAVVDSWQKMAMNISKTAWHD